MTDPVSHEQPQTGTNILYKDLSYKIVDLAIEVRKKLGLGFLEKVYENALMILFEREGIEAVQQSPVEVYFEGKRVGHYVADILVSGKIILEIKCAEGIHNEHRAQVINYLKATGLRLALILNFGKRSFDHERIIL